MSRRSFHASLRGPGLTTVLNTGDYGCWEAAVTGVLGHHRSWLLSGSENFHARFRVGQVDELQILHIKGSGQLELVREQCDQAVLWLPLQGISEEIVNGVSWVLEPGKALLFQPGDQMHGYTSEKQEGISILIPMEGMPELQQPTSSIFQAGPIHQQVLSAVRQLTAAAAQRLPGASWAADALLESLCQATLKSEPLPTPKIEPPRRGLWARSSEWFRPGGGDASCWSWVP